MQNQEIHTKKSKRKRKNKKTTQNYLEIKGKMIPRKNPKKKIINQKKIWNPTKDIKQIAKKQEIHPYYLKKPFQPQKMPKIAKIKTLQIACLITNMNKKKKIKIKEKAQIIKKK